MVISPRANENGPRELTFDESFSLSALFKLPYTNVYIEYISKIDRINYESGLNKSEDKGLLLL